MTNSIKDLNKPEQYMTSFYFVVTTMTTVGYGDMSPSTQIEQVFVVLLMSVGVFVFSLVTGSLASILSSMDSMNAALNEKILFLGRLKDKYDLPDDLYNEISKTLTVEAKSAAAELDEFVE